MNELMQDPVRLLVGFSEGSASSIVAGMITAPLSKVLNRVIAVERILGENGALCMERVARAAPDGRTLGVAIQANIVGSLLHARKRYDPLVDLTPVALIANAPLVLAVSNKLTVDSVQELVRLLRLRPGELEYGASAIGGAPHLAGVMFSAMTNTRMRLRVYAETDVLYADLAADRISITFNNLMSAVPLARTGQLRMLAVTGRKRSTILPDIPTINEAGIEDYDVTVGVGLVAPANTPSSVIKPINDAVNRVIADAGVHQALLASGMEPVVASPEAFSTYFRESIKRWREFISVHRAEFVSRDSSTAD